jgi:general secretion pathway protein D
VPALGDVPLLGWLFKKRSDESVKTNLYVFLTPRVIKNPGEALGIYQQKKEHIETIKEGEIKYYEKHSEKAEESTTITEPIQKPERVEPRVIEPR